MKQQSNSVTSEWDFHATAFFNTKKAAKEEENDIKKVGAYYANAYPVDDGWMVDFTVRLTVSLPAKKKATFKTLHDFYSKWADKNRLGYWWNCSYADNAVTGERVSE